MTGRRRLAAVLSAALAVACTGPLSAETCNPAAATFRWNGGETRFDIELAITPAQRERGLMFRDRMPATAGMLFVFDHPQDVAFWMKNTRIPLDMLFIGPDGQVLAVHPDAIPGDLTPIPGPPRATEFVLEINGGLARRLGLAPGAVMRHPAVAQDRALWPCDAP